MARPAAAASGQRGAEREPASDSLFRTKSVDRLHMEARASGEGTLKRTLGPWALVALGIGAVIGAGLFVRTAAAIADRAGPSVTVAFIVAGIGCAFAGLCYAEFASMIPVAGSAYTYSYATMGELVAWIIGWDLVLEYAAGDHTPLRRHHGDPGRRRRRVLRLHRIRRRFDGGAGSEEPQARHADRH